MYFLLGVLAAALVLYAIVLKGATGKKVFRNYRSAASSRGYRGHVDAQEIRASMDNILAVSRTGASGLKSAINEADKLFDHVMRQLGFPGETMGERLKSSRHRFSSYSIYDSIWRAHKLRNSLAHDIGFDLVPSQAKDAIRDFERGLKDLGAL